MKELRGDVGPELASQVHSSRGADVVAKLRGSESRAALGVWIVEIADAGGGQGAPDLRNVEGATAAVGAGYQHARQRVTKARTEPGFVAAIVARILVEQRGQEESSEKLVGGSVGRN